MPISEAFLARLPPDEVGRFWLLKNEHDELTERLRELRGQLRDVAKSYGVSELDGIAEDQTVSLRDKHGASGININKWWVATALDWRCPASDRTKSEIVRLDSSGRLWGHVVPHHDHFRDCLEDIMQERSLALGAISQDDAAKGFLTRFSDALSRFDDVLVCGDCNAADPVAKKIVQAPKSLSFSPREIREMCDIAPNVAHRVDAVRALSVHNRAFAAHALRCESAVRLADRALRAEHWYEATDFTARPNRVESKARHTAELYGGGIDLTVLAGATSTSSIFDTWRRSVVSVVANGPTAAELAFMSTKDHSRWNQFDDQWSCPCCLRTKHQAVSQTKSQKWQFKPATATFSDGRYEVCHDCVQTHRDFRKEAEKTLDLRDTSAAMVSLDQLRTITAARPYSKHEINNAAVEQLIAFVPDASQLE